MHAYVVAEQLSIRHASSSSIAVGRPIRCQDNLNSVDKRMCLAAARRSIQCGASGLAIVFGWRMRCRICRVGAQRPYRQRLHTAPVISVRPSRPRGASRGPIRGAMQEVLTRHAAARLAARAVRARAKQPVIFERIHLESERHVQRVVCHDDVSHLVTTLVSDRESVRTLLKPHV